MSASETTTKEPPEENDSETPAEPLAGPSQVKEDNAAPATTAVAKKTEPMGGIPSMLSPQQPGKEASRAGEEGEKSSPASSPNKPAPGHAAKSIPSTSSSSLSSSPSTSTVSPGRAKMSVSGPGSSKSTLPPAPSCSSATASSSPSISPAPPKIHRARKTMNRPPPGQVNIEGSLNMSDHSSESETQRTAQSRNESEESSWPPSDQEKERNTADVVETLGAGRSAEYTEVPLGALDIAAADSLTLSPHHDGSDAGDTERLEELPLCSCRMEAPRVDSTSHRVSRQCMATESINGELRACTSRTIKGETMRPSSRVPLMVLCDVHRSHMVKHHCCPGCGYFCIAGTFLECCPDQRIAHRFHRGCVTVLGGGRSRANGGGMLFCPHCGEDASEAQEVTIPSFSSSTASATTVVTMSASSTTTPSLPPSVPTAPSLTASTGGMKDGKMPERPVSARMRSHGLVTLAVEQQQPPQPVASVATVATIPPAEEGVDSVGPSLCMPNGKPISPGALPPGPSRAALQKAILTQDTERRKKLRFHPRQLYPAAKQGEVQRVLLMLMEGIDPTYQPDSQNRRSALHAAAQRGLLEVCYMLVQAGAQVDAQDKDLRTPLLEAIINNHFEVARYLVQNGACVYHVEEDGYTGLHHAAKLGSLEIVSMLLETGQVDVNAQDSGGWTPIIWAAEHKHVDVIRALLNRGADVTINDKELNVCLHWAAYAGNVDIAELVLNAGCSLASVNMHGDTPLHIAAREGYLECVTLFLSRGADIDIMNREGDTPLTLARVDTPVWVALQINRKLRRGITNRMLRTERIICSDIAQGYENVPIPCVNAVDDEGCPSDYKYVSENCETSAMNIDRNITHLQHCSCTDDCSSSNCLCGQLSIRCWYDKVNRNIVIKATSSKPKVPSELTGPVCFIRFDYGDRFWDIKSKYFTCQCGSEKCKHSAEAIALEQSRLARLEACPESGADCGIAMLGNS
ncbi:histone-lysine N-methyltransferase EHMT2-like [Seriola lalandi dorsalis]|uniref:histone-lysine N-methyltransferase EHMT2-like n=1 Tax=Seriola lalandi dorsalis TaxID=1841481 RepID=UPI000C6FA130|nr:histone-lysine N-methyltransferase EHMT2-like [Seriola lalandi dorsalis]